MTHSGPHELKPDAEPADHPTDDGGEQSPTEPVPQAPAVPARNLWGLPTWAWVVGSLALGVVILAARSGLDSSNRGASAADHATPTRTVGATSTSTPKPAASQPATRQDITRLFDLQVTYFNGFWKNWRAKVVPSLLAEKPDYDSAYAYASAYQKYARDGVAALDRLAPTDATASTLASLRTALAALATGSEAASKAATAHDGLALEDAASALADGARILEAVKPLVDALP